MTYYGPWQTLPNLTDHHDFDNTGDFLEPPSTYWTSTGTTENDAARGASFTPTFTEHIQVGHVVDMSSASPSTYRWGRFVLTWTPPYHSYPPPPPAGASWDFADDGAVLDATLTLTPHGAVTGFAGVVNYGLGDWRGTSGPTPVVAGSFAFGDAPTIPISTDPFLAGSGLIGAASLGSGVGLLFDVWDNLMIDGVPSTVVNDTAFVDLYATITATIRPSQFRAAYEGRPPLAHRQRRDGAATAGPQLAHIGTSGGRPPLAWRQNNP